MNLKRYHSQTTEKESRLSLQGLSVPPEYIKQSLKWMLESPKANTFAEELVLGILSMFNETASKTVH